MILVIEISGNKTTSDRILIQNFLLGYDLIISSEICLVNNHSASYLLNSYSNFDNDTFQGSHFPSARHHVSESIHGSSFSAARHGNNYGSSAFGNQHSHFGPNTSKQYNSIGFSKSHTPFESYSKPSKPRKYRINAHVTGFEKSKSEMEKKLKTKNHYDDIKIISYEFESWDNLKEDKKTNLSTSPDMFFHPPILNQTVKTPAPLTGHPEKTLNDQLHNILARHTQKHENYVSLDVVLRRVAASGNIEDLKFLVGIKNINLDSQDNTPGKFFTALHWAAKKGHIESFNLLLEAGANPDIRDYSDKRAAEYIKQPTAENTGFNYTAIFK